MTIERPMFPPVDLTRRRFLTVAAGSTIAATIPTAARAAAPTVDPIFELIDIHKKAEAAHLAAIKELDRLDRIPGFKDWGITEQPCDDEFNAFDAVVGAAATTLPGLLAKLAYLQDVEEWMLDEREGTAHLLIESFAGSLQNIWGIQS